MPNLLFADLDALRLVLASGAAPTEVSTAPARRGSISRAASGCTSIVNFRARPPRR